MSDILTQNNVRVIGKGQPLLFVHGFGCDHNMWRFVAPAFDQDYQIILLDLIGAGDSDSSAYNIQKYGSLEGHADDIINICETLNLKDVVFIGHSVSAMIGILADIKKPGLFCKLILIGPSPCYVNQGEYIGGFERKEIEGMLEIMEADYKQWANAIAPKIMGNLNRTELGQELAKSFCRTDPNVTKHFARVTFLSDTRNALPKVNGTCLILQCKDDIIAPEFVGEYVHQNIPKSKYVLMNATGHCPHMSAPSETIENIQLFLEA